MGLAVLSLAPLTDPGRWACWAGFPVWCTANREAVDLQSRKWSYSFTVEIPQRRDSVLPRKIRGDGGSDAPDPECVRCFQGRGLWRGEGWGEGAGWILPIHCFSGSIVCSWLILFLRWLPSASEASAFGTWALLASVAFEGYLQTVSFNFILKQWFKNVWKLLSLCSYLILGGRIYRNRWKLGCFSLRDFAPDLVPAFPWGPCRASKQSYETESSVLFSQDSQDPELSHDWYYCFIPPFNLVYS